MAKMYLASDIDKRVDFFNQWKNDSKILEIAHPNLYKKFYKEYTLNFTSYLEELFNFCFTDLDTLFDNKLKDVEG